MSISSTVLMAVLLMLVSVSSSHASNFKRDDSDSNMFIKAELSKQSPYVNEPVVLDIFLYTQNPELQYVNAASLLSLTEKEENCIIFPVDGEREIATRETIAKKEYYRLNIGKYVLVPTSEGKIVFSPVCFNIGVPVRVVRQDPFWGDFVSYESENVVCSSDKISLKVKKLPAYKGVGNFSGCVGEFTLNSYLPPGSISKDKEATFVVELEGNGWVPDSALPDYRNAFGKSSRLKSVSENRNRSYRDTNLYSELELVCEFIPESEDEFEIGGIDIVYFNPATGRYETAKASSVKESYDKKKTKRESSGELMEI